MRWRTTTVVALALGAGVIGAAAAAADDHVPADAKICRKYDEKGSKAGTTVHLGGGRHRYNGGDGNDRIFGGPRDDIINGGRGSDVVHGGGGDDVVCGGLGNDRVDGDEGRDRVYGEEQNDYVTGGAGNDYINGQAGRDRVIGYGKRRGRVVADGKDLLDGSFERDVLVAGGFDSLLGGADDDRLSTRTKDEPVRKMDGYIGDDRISGSATADRRLLGDIGADVIRGGGGNDRIDGGKSDDDLFGGGGDDLLHGGDNVDALSGGDGEDVCDGGGSNRDTADGTCERVRDVP